MTHDAFILIPVLVAGLFLGTIFFGGLWWTVQNMASSKIPELLFFISLLLRTSLVLTSLYLVAHGHWERFVACLIGFFMARLIVTYLTREAPYAS